MEQVSHEAQIDKKYTDYQRTLGLSVPEINLSDFEKVVKESDTILVDVREPEERQISIIPSAISIDDFNQKLTKGEITDNFTVIAYCTIGVRSALFVDQILKKTKISKIYNFRGSILLWCHSHPVVNPKDNQPTHNIHVYGPDWALVPAHMHAETFSIAKRALLKSRAVVSYLTN
jgi:rhodanese-related sulfurtransferase